MQVRKLKLDPEKLRVTSFDAQQAVQQARGTVKGHDPVPSPTDIPCTLSWEYPRCNC